MTKNKAKNLRMEEIVTAAVEEFLKKGYERASMEHIALRAGLSKGGLYHHFRSKDEILIYAARKIAAPLDELYMRINSEGSATKALEYYIEEYLHFWIKNPKSIIFYFISMIKAFQDKGHSAIYADYAKELFSLLESIFNRGIQQGEFIEHDPFMRAIALQSAMDGLLAYLMFDESISREEVIRGFREVFINDILKPQDI